jgi:hypothetical protein
MSAIKFVINGQALFFLLHTDIYGNQHHMLLCMFTFNPFSLLLFYITTTLQGTYIRQHNKNKGLAHKDIEMTVLCQKKVYIQSTKLNHLIKIKKKQFLKHLPKNTQPSVITGLNLGRLRIRHVENPSNLTLLLQSFMSPSQPVEQSAEAVDLQLSAELRLLHYSHEGSWR